MLDPHVGDLRVPAEAAVETDTALGVAVAAADGARAEDGEVGDLGVGVDVEAEVASCGWLMPPAWCGGVSVYSWECHMPAPRMVTSRMPTWLNCPRFSGSSVRIFCS